jgi:hypothetical protein
LLALRVARLRVDDTFRSRFGACCGSLGAPLPL